jgi:hypothetical protein
MTRLPASAVGVAPLLGTLFRSSEVKTWQIVRVGVSIAAITATRDDKIALPALRRSARALPIVVDEARASNVLRR